MGQTHVVIGAAGGLGAAVVRKLAERGLPVRAVVRDAARARKTLPPDVEVVSGDAKSVESLKEAAEGAAVLYPCANAPYHEWAAFFPDAVAAVLGAAAATGAVVAFPDNTYLYGPFRSSPITEAHPHGAASGIGKVRVDLVDRLLKAHKSGEARVVIARYPNFYGPGVTNRFAGGMFEAALAGQTAKWLGRLDQPHSMIYIEDVAEALVFLGGEPRAYGEEWHVPGGGAVTGREFLTMIFEEVGQPPKIGTMASTMTRLLGLFVPVVRALNETMYQFDSPMVLDGSRYEKAFGPPPATPHPEGIRRTVAWFRVRQQRGEGA